MACNTPGMGTIVVEIGPNNFFIPKNLEITRSRVPGQSSAKFTLEIESGEMTPRVPSICAIIGSNGVKIFSGLYQNEDLKFINNGTTRQYGITVSDFFPLTRRRVIGDYRETNIFSAHLVAANAINNGPTVSLLHLIDLEILGATNEESELVDGQPDPFSVPYEFGEFTGYLNDFLTQQCEIANCNWEIKDSSWQRVSVLSGLSGSLARIIVRKNGTEFTLAPKNPIYVPFSQGNLICPNDVIFENFSLSRKGPLVDRTTITGRNGKPFQDPALDELTNTEIIKHDIPPTPDPASAILSYNFKETATFITQVKVIPKDPV